MTVVGPEQRGNAADEKYGIDDPRQDQRADREKANTRKARCRIVRCRCGGQATPAPQLDKEQGQRQQAADPGAGREQVRGVRGKLETAYPTRPSSRMADASDYHDLDRAKRNCGTIERLR